MKRIVRREAFTVLTVAIFASAGYMKLCNGPDCSLDVGLGCFIKMVPRQAEPRRERALYERIAP